MGRKPVRGYSVVTRLFYIAILAVACARATAAPLSPADRNTIQQQQQFLSRTSVSVMNWSAAHRYPAHLLTRAAQRLPSSPLRV